MLNKYYDKNIGIIAYAILCSKARKKSKVILPRLFLTKNDLGEQGAMCYMGQSVAEIISSIIMLVALIKKKKIYSIVNIYSYKRFKVSFIIIII